MQVQYGDDEKTFTMTQLAGMYMTVMKKIAEAALQTPVHDCVISVPAYYTDRQRHALIGAAEIAGLNPLRLLSEPAAAALVYGITRARELPEKDKDPRHVVFVDIGQSATTVSVVAFTQEKATVRACVRGCAPPAQLRS
jgi:heat shock 70kDa protein 4